MEYYRHIAIIGLFAILLQESFVSAQLPPRQCPLPPPVKDFNVTAHAGLWYEIGKVQPPGPGRFFQRNCVCTATDIFKAPFSSEPSDYDVIYTCRDKKPSGRETASTSLLRDMKDPGYWKEISYDPADPSDHTVIMEDPTGSHYSVLYTCNLSDNLPGKVNYCIHVMSRTPTIDSELLSEILQKAERMGLNLYNMPYTETGQRGCW